MFRLLILLVCAGTLAACASNRCNPDAPHHRAVAYPPLQDAPGVPAPEPTDEFVIPDVAATNAPATPGDDALGCLDVPPKLPARQDQEAATPEA